MLVSTRAYCFVVRTCGTTSGVAIKLIDSTIHTLLF
jgi:hypothetical protein